MSLQAAAPAVATLLPDSTSTAASSLAQRLGKFGGEKQQQWGQPPTSSKQE